MRITKLKMETCIRRFKSKIITVMTIVALGLLFVTDFAVIKRGYDLLEKITCEEVFAGEVNYINNPTFTGEINKNTNDVLPSWKWKFKTNSQTLGPNGNYWNDSTPYDTSNPSTGWEARFLPFANQLNLETWLRSDYKPIGSNTMSQVISGLKVGETYVLKGNLSGATSGTVRNVDTYVALDGKSVASLKDITGNFIGYTPFEYRFTATKTNYNLELVNYTPAESISKDSSYNSQYANLSLTAEKPYDGNAHKPTINPSKEGDKVITGT
ncbi:hypothetical protein ACJEEJ_13370, partial [Enterococcus faecalis]|uniref:hypothetical protein n=1 Tax=Enterococcus faecalis TaxID=1351 RepID=UPI0039853020